MDIDPLAWFASKLLINEKKPLFVLAHSPYKNQLNSQTA